MKDNQTISVNIVIPDVIILLVFIILKLTGVINWSWWWITAPLWLPVVVAIAIFIVLLHIYFISVIVNTMRNNSINNNKQS